VTLRFSRFASILTLAAASLAAASLHAADLFWEDAATTGDLNGLNYFNFTDSLPDQQPALADIVHVGNQSTANLSTPGVVTYSKLRVGHNQQSGYNGFGVVNISGGAQVELTGGASDGTGPSGAGGNAALWVGNNQNDSVLNIDGADSKVTSNHGIVIGISNNNPLRTGTVNVTNGGSLIATAGTIKLGERAAAPTAMDPRISTNAGHLNVNGIVQGGSLYVGMRDTTSTYTQTGGTATFTGAVEVAPANSGANNKSVFTLSGGTFGAGNNFFLGRGESTGAIANIQGGEFNVTGRYLMGGQTGTGAVTNHSAGTLNTTQDVRVGDGSPGTMQYNFSGGTINATTGGYVGRNGTAQFIQTGGTANFNGVLNIGNRDTTTVANDGLYKISSGTLNAGANSGAVGINIAPNGIGQLRVVGDDGMINVLGSLSLGNTANGLGTLAFEFETGDLLSQINVVNAATFAAGTKLVLDATNAAPTQLSYDLLTAASIDATGLLFEGPAGWTHEVVSGGNGQILRAVAPGGPTDDADFDGDGDVDGQDFLTWQRGLGGDPTSANGNANGDGAIDGADLAVWEDQFAAASSVPAAAAVPEPSSIALLAVAAGWIAAGRLSSKRAAAL
jgi:hypothetical protein